MANSSSPQGRGVGLGGRGLLAVGWEGWEAPEGPPETKEGKAGKGCHQLFQAVVGQLQVPIGNCGVFKFSL